MSPETHSKCDWCGSIDLATKTLCAICLDKKRQGALDRRARYRAERKCFQCGTLMEAGQTGLVCLTCLELKRQQSKVARASRLAIPDQCNRCGKVGEGSPCPRCREQRASYIQQLQAMGLCRCNRVAMAGKRTCEVCAKRDGARWKTSKWHPSN